MTTEVTDPRDSRDPRDPQARIEKILDSGSFTPLTNRDESGMLAAFGTVSGTRVSIFAADATIQGGAMGEAGVARCLEIIEQELSLTMGFCGRTDIKDVGSDILFDI